MYCLRNTFDLCLSWHNTREVQSGSDVLDFQICYSAMEIKFTFLRNKKKGFQEIRRGAKVVGKYLCDICNI